MEFNDPGLQDYLATMIESSHAESLSSSSGYHGIPPTEVSFDRIPETLNDDYFYDAVGHGAVTYEVGRPGDVRSPVTNQNARGAGKKKRGNKKRKRDPNKPKGWLSAILMYSNAHRARIKLENPDATFGDIARLLSAEYKSLSPQEKAFWEKAHVDDRERYDREMLSYVPPSHTAPCGGDGSGCSVEAIVIGGAAEIGRLEAEEPHAKKPRKKKDPNAPKRNLSAWQFFSGGDARKQVIANHQGASLKETMVILSQKYNLLSEEERAPLDLMAAADKERYHREMAEYRGNQSY